MNPKASRRGRNSGRAGLTLTSTIALALGGAAVVAPTPHAGAQEAAGENLAYTGDIVARNDQHDSEALVKDSCAVQLNKTDKLQNRAGLTLDWQNPADESPSKTAFGLQMHFDTSKQRTFTGATFTDGGRVPAPAGEVSTVPVGEKLTRDNPFTVNDEADPANIDGGRQRNLNGDFTFSEQFQQKATSSEGLTLAWRGNYLSDNPQIRYFDSDSFFVEAKVNPWPNETDSCQSLKLDWADVSKAVVKPGQKVKIATASIDTKTDTNAAESDLARLRIKVADGNGKTLENATITREGSDFFLTWPTFVDDEVLDSLQGLQFTAVAMPRTVEQLHTLANTGKNEFDEPNKGGVTDSSIALPRYNTANEISSHAISVDDTLYHDPQYKKNQVTITSGIVDGEPSDQTQKITFEPVADENGDTLADLKKKYDAEITLDDRLVYEGWTAEFADPEKDDYRVIVTAPAGFDKPDPGTFAQPVVNVRYSNGSKDVIPLLVVVAPNHTQQTQLDYPAEPTAGAQDTKLTAKAKLTRVLGKGDVIKPKTYELVDGSYDKDNWEVSVDEHGNVTAKSKEDVPNFTTITPKVKATYPDGTIDEAPVSFQVVSNVKVPEYGATSGKAKDTVTLKPTLPQIGLGGKETDEQPNRYTFPDGSLEYKRGDWTITVDEKTGELTSTIPENALPGAYITVPVKTHYASGSVPQEVTGTINVIGDGTGSDIANYPSQVTKAGVPVSSNINTQLSDPKLAKYKLPKRLPKGWTFDVADDGTVTATPPEDAKPGDEETIDIHVTYPDGSEADVPVTVTVVGADKDMNNPKYPTKHGKPGGKATSPVDGNDIRKESEPKYSLITNPEDPNYIAPPRNLTWDQVKIDPDTGTITTTISENAVPGTSADIPVRVTYKDGSTDTTIATVVVVGDQAKVHEPRYAQQETKPGVAKTSDITKDTKVPEKDLAAETPYSVPKTVDGWTVSVDDKGVVTATPPADAKPGDHIDVPVTVKYQDGSEDVVNAPFVVRIEDKDIYEPGYSVESTAPNKSVKRQITPKDLPKGTEYRLDGTEQDGWKYEINPDTGEVTVTPPADAKPGDKQTKNVKVTYPDGSTEDVPVTTVVNLSNNYEAEPAYPPETTYPGEQAVSPLSIEKPEGLEVAKENPYLIQPAEGKITPTGENNEFGNPIYKVLSEKGKLWDASLDENGNILATPPKDAEPGDLIHVPVLVTYADGSVDTTSAPITVVDQPTRELPFDVKVVEDPNVPAGQHKVVTPGEPGTEVMDRDGNWVHKKDPVTEVIHVGTKPATAGTETTWTAPIPHGFIERPNPDLEPGTIKVVEEGENGEKTFTADFSATGGEAGVETKEETTKQPKDRIVEYGPAADATELVTKTTKRVPFETEVTIDPILKPGEKVVDQQGEYGEEVETSTQKIENGKPSGDPVVETKRTKEPVTEKIRVGGAPTENTDVTTTKVEVPFETRIVFDPELEVGEQKVDPEHPGVPGEDKVTTTRTIENSQITDTRTEKTRVTDPQDRIIRVGTKEKPGVTPEIHWTEETPFKVIVKEDPTLDAGTHKIAQPGKVGKISYKVIDGVPQKPEVQEPVDQIILVGTKKQTKQTELRETIHTPVPFETEIRKVDTLPAGAVRTKQEGTYGEKVTEKVWKLVDGTVQGDPVENTTDIKQPTKRIIEVGVGKVVPTYGKIVQDPGATNEVPLQEGSKVPANAKVEIDPDWKPEIEGWKASIDEHGNVLSTPPANAKPGDSVLIPVKVTYGDGSSVIVPAFASVKDKSDTPKANYGALKTLPGETHTQQPENTTEGDKFSVPGDVDGWKVSVNDNGVVSATTPKDAKPGDWIRVPVTVTPKNGETYTTYAVFTVGNQPIKPSEPLKPGEPGQPDEPGQPGEPGSPEVPGLYYPSAITTPGAEAQIKIGKHTDGNTYALGALPKGWKATVSKEGDLLVTPPADATPGEKVEIPVTVTTASGKKYEVKTVVGVIAKDSSATDKPGKPGEGSSADGFKRCMANMFALNSPILWLLPIGLAAAVGAPVAEALQPQLNGLTAQFNEAVRRNTPDWGHGGHGWERPDWVREIDAQVAAINKQFASVGEQLRPIGIALGAIAVGALAISLIKQACEPEGFDYGMTIFGSSKEGEPSAASSKKGAIHDAIMGGSSKENKEK